MEKLSRLEDAVLHAIVSQFPAEIEALRSQLLTASVTDRHNTGAGFYTTFSVDASCAPVSLSSPIGNVAATVPGLAHGMGFILWLRDGRLYKLEGFSFDDDTSALDLEATDFDLVDNRP